LANERTFLAWVRTSLAMMAGGVVLQTVATPLPSGLRQGLSVLLVLSGGSLALLAWRRWAAVETAMRTGAPIPAFRSAVVISTVLAVSALLLAVALVLD
jgi:putative membrane protein